MWNIWECGESHTGCCSGNLIERDHLEEYMGVWREAHRVLVGKLDRKRPLGRIYGSVERGIQGVVRET